MPGHFGTWLSVDSSAVKMASKSAAMAHHLGNRKASPGRALRRYVYKAANSVGVDRKTSCDR
jgi:hypothetical protein